MITKPFLYGFLCISLTIGCYAQGIVNFFNTSTTLIVTESPSEPISTSGVYYFGLFTADEGTTDRSKFVFTGLYATNSTLADGRLTGGSVAVPNWPVGITKSFLIRGWSASVGHDWQTVLASGAPWGIGGPGYYGESAIASGKAGGVLDGNTLPYLPLFGSVTLQGFTLRPLFGTPVPAQITKQPASQTVLQWREARIEVEATGDEPIYYTWYLNSEAIPNSNTNALVFPKVQLTNSGDYTVLVTNFVGAELSTKAVLTVLPAGEPPYIITHPVSQIITQGGNVTHTVQAGGITPLTYQWQRNGFNLEGANAETLSFTNVQLTYDCRVIVSNTEGSITSAVATVRFPAGPGTVIFKNMSTSPALIRVYGSTQPTEPVAGRYYFGLFSAPAGSTDPNAFVFTGVYATNQSFAGRYFGGTAVVTNWTPGQTYAILIRGWSGSLGHDWPEIEAQWKALAWVTLGFFGSSEIGTVVAGGFDGQFLFPSDVTASALTNSLVMDIVHPTSPVVLAPAAPPSAQGFRLKIYTPDTVGLPFRGYAHFWSSTNAVDWTPLEWVYVWINGQDYLDTNAPAPQRFYKVME